MEQSFDTSTHESEFVRKLSARSIPSSSNEPSVSTLLLNSKEENRDEEELSIFGRREMKGELPSAPATLMCGAMGTRHETITMVEKAKCPCCQQSFGSRPSTPNEPRLLIRQTPSLFTVSDEENTDVNTIYEDMLPGTLAEGIHYHPTGVLVQGWLHKKGTGKDWLGSTSWKARWARLITAKVDGYSCEVPLMQIYWHSSAPIPSTVILLESTVVLAVDLNDKDQWDSFQFEIRHAATKENPTISVTRTFTAPKLSRDTWVYMISEALLSFEKDMAFHKKNALSTSCRGDTGFFRSAPMPSNSDRSASPGMRRSMCPPSRLPRPNRRIPGSDSNELPRGQRIPRLTKENAAGPKADIKTAINEWYVYPPALVVSSSGSQDHE